MKQLSHVELAKINGGITGDPDEIVERIVGDGDPDNPDHSNQDLIGG